MPNHVQNQITAPTEVIEAITRGYSPDEIQAYKDETESIRERELSDWFTADRKALALKSRGERAEEMLTEKIVDFNMVIPQPANIETGGCSMRHDPGVICWREWSISNWGTKWNAYQTEIEHRADGTSQLRFQTAWSHPDPVIEKLSKKFPETVIEVSYADEDFGFNLGKYSIKNDERTDSNAPDEGGHDATDFAAQLHYGKTYAELQKEWDNE